VAVDDQLATRSPADDLLDRLEEPSVVASLHTLLDHADLLAVLVVALDGFIGRGDVIADSLADAVGELRSAAESSSNPLAGVDVKGLIATAGALAGPLAAAAPALTSMLEKVRRPETVQVVDQLTAAVSEVQQTGPGDSAPTGVFALLRTLKDPDVARGIDFFVQLAKAFGKQRGR
jgi:hypothetical protein